MDVNVGVVALFIVAVAIIGLFSYLSVASWATERRREREAYYRYELARKLAENPGPAAQVAMDFVREEERRLEFQRRQSRRLSGLITIACGIGLLVFLIKMEHQEPAYLVALIPLLVGIVLWSTSFASGKAASADRTKSL